MVAIQRKHFQRKILSENKIAKNKNSEKIFSEEII
jgi:hypothetical protein